jgi:hypothetical protein
MKKFYFEADKKQWEKPTEPKYMFCATAKVWAVAETEEEARAIALEKLSAKYHGTGTILDDVHLRLTKSADLPVDWNYGYGDERGTGTPEDKAALLTNNLGRL